MLDSISANPAVEMNSPPRRSQLFIDLAFAVMRRCQAFTLTLNSAGQILFAAGCLLAVFLVRTLSQAFRNNVIS